MRDRGQFQSGRRASAILAATALLALVLAAVASCGSNGPTPSPVASQTAPPTTSPSPSLTSSPSPAPFPTPTGPFWFVDPSTFPSQSPDLIAAIEALSVRPSTGTLFQVDSLLVSGDWAIAWAAVEPFPSALASPAETVVVIGHLVGGNWVLVSDRDPTFCAVLAQAPQDIANDQERAYFSGSH